MLCSLLFCTLLFPGLFHQRRHWHSWEIWLYYLMFQLWVLCVPASMPWSHLLMTMLLCYSINGWVILAFLYARSCFLVSFFTKINLHCDVWESKAPLHLTPPIYKPSHPSTNIHCDVQTVFWENKLKELWRLYGLKVWAMRHKSIVH